jgi:hypothetical protein
MWPVVKPERSCLISDKGKNSQRLSHIWRGYVLGEALTYMLVTCTVVSTELHLAEEYKWVENCSDEKKTKNTMPLNRFSVANWQMAKHKSDHKNILDDAKMYRFFNKKLPKSGQTFLKTVLYIEDYSIC